jgi:glyoxylase-like metal-dependent hydrolase (beta-lactamase superfamily II)
MQEIASKVYIETGYSGVTLGAINWPHGLVLIDSPFRADEVRSWRSALLNLGGGIDRILINMDGHKDRTLGVRSMECTIMAHADLAESFNTRPATFKTIPNGSGAEWEEYDHLGNVRWAPPEIVLTEEVQINWEENPMLIKSQPGCGIGALWVELPKSKVLFIGDCVVIDQPPFLEDANLPVWLETLQKLRQPEYQDYLVVSGRGGLLHPDHVRRQVDFLQTVHQMMEDFAKRQPAVEETQKLVNTLLNMFDIPPMKERIYHNRLSYGLASYYAKHYFPASEDM